MYINSLPYSYHNLQKSFESSKCFKQFHSNKGLTSALPRTMIMLCRNVQGLGYTWMFKALYKVLQMYHPKILFLYETKLKSREIEILKKKLHFDHYLIVVRNGLKWMNCSFMECKCRCKDYIFQHSLYKFYYHSREWK